MAYVLRLYLFWYEWKEKTHSYTRAPIKRILGVQFSSSQGAGNHPLLNRITEKGKQTKKQNKTKQNNKNTKQKQKQKQTNKKTKPNKTKPKM